MLSRSGSVQACEDVLGNGRWHWRIVLLLLVQEEGNEEGGEGPKEVACELMGKELIVVYYLSYSRGGGQGKSDVVVDVVSLLAASYDVSSLQPEVQV